MKIKVDDQISLSLLDENLCPDFYHSIHETKDFTDQYRIRLQKKYPTLQATKDRIYDAVYNKYGKDRTPDFFVIKNERIIGMFEFHPLSKEDHIEVGFWLYKNHHKKGIMSSIFPLMIEYAKKNFKKSKMMATTPLGNVPSQKLLESVGFQKTANILQVDNGNGKIEKELVYFFPLSD